MEAPTITLRLLSDDALPLLHQLERVHWVEIIAPQAPKRSAADFGGLLAGPAGADLAEHAEQIRREWDRDF